MLPDNLRCFCFEFTENLWENVSEQALQQSVTDLENDIAHAASDNIDVQHVKTLLDWLAKDKEIVHSSASQQHPRSSALRLVYILHQAYKKNFDMLIPRHRSQMTAKRMENHEYKCVLDSFQPSGIADIIGFRGENLKDFQKEHKCGIFLTMERDDDGVEKLFLRIAKKCASTNELPLLVEPLKKHIHRKLCRMDDDDVRTFCINI